MRYLANWLRWGWPCNCIGLWCEISILATFCIEDATNFNFSLECTCNATIKIKFVVYSLRKVPRALISHLSLMPVQGSVCRVMHQFTFVAFAWPLPHYYAWWQRRRFVNKLPNLLLPIGQDGELNSVPYLSRWMRVQRANDATAWTNWSHKHSGQSW